MNLILFVHLCFKPQFLMDIVQLLNNLKDIKRESFVFQLVVKLKIYYGNKIENKTTYRSHCRSVQLAIIQSETMKTRRTVPGQMVIRVFKTKRVLKLIRLSAPILLDEASVNNLLCNNITRQIRYSRRNIGNDKGTSYGTHFAPMPPFLFASFVVHTKL